VKNSVGVVTFATYEGIPTNFLPPISVFYVHGVVKGENIITMNPKMLCPSILPEVEMMNDVQRERIRELRAEGYSYGRVSQVLGISENTIKTFCRRNSLGGMAATPTHTEAEEHSCLCCGIPVAQVSGRKEKKFCSDRCRNKWWNSHLEQVKRKANYQYVCPYCKRPFTAYRVQQEENKRV
jgi:hypothetical protein